MIKAIVTGHSRGLGAAIAAQLLERAIPVLGLARARNEALALRFGAALEQCELDLSDTAQVERWLGGDSLSRFLAGAQRAVLVNNAGTVQPVGPLDSQRPGEIARAVALNVATPMMLTAVFAAATAAAADRRVVHISSGAARNPIAGWSVYCGTKAALDLHARAVAADATRALRICSLAPGVVDTDMQAEVRSTDATRFPMLERFQAMKRDGALSSAEDCAKKLVDYLLEDRFGQEQVADIRQI